MRKPLRLYFVRGVLAIYAASLLLTAFSMMTPLDLVRVFVAGILVIVVGAFTEGVVNGARRVREEMARLQAERVATDAKLREAMEKLKALNALSVKIFGPGGHTADTHGRPLRVGQSEDEIHVGDAVEVNPKTGLLRRAHLPPLTSDEDGPAQ